MSQRWTPEQHALAVEHKAMSDEDLADLVSAVGPERTPKAVMEYLKVKKVQRPHLDTVSIGPSGRVVTAAFLQAMQDVRERGLDARRGWPTPLGDKEFLRRLYAGLNQRAAA